MLTQHASKRQAAKAQIMKQPRLAAEAGTDMDLHHGGDDSAKAGAKGGKGKKSAGALNSGATVVPENFSVGPCTRLETPFHHLYPWTAAMLRRPHR